MAPLSLPPGPRYVTRQLPNLILPPLAVYVLSRLSREHLGLALPPWLLVLAYALSWPAALVAHVQWKDFANARRAQALGAVIPREVDHKYPGSVDLLKDMFVNDKTNYLVETLFRWTEQYGPIFNFRVMFEDRMFTSEPEYIKMMLATEFNHYEKGPLLNSQLETLLGVGVFNSDGDMWKFHRSMTRPFFSKDRISHFDIFDRHAEHALNKAAERLREGVPVDWQDVVSRFTMDSATEFLFGKDVQSLSAPIPYPSTHPAATRQQTAPVHPADRFVRAFQDALEATAIRGRFLQSWPLTEMVADKVRRHLTAVDEFIDPIVEDALRKNKNKETGLEGVTSDVEKASRDQVRDDETLLEHLCKFTDDHKVIKDETLNILLAGRDTTSCTLTFAVYALAEHPDVLKRLRKEVLDVVGPTARPTYDNVREMKYMRAFINEVLRLYPPVPVNSRCSIESMRWKNTTPGQPDHYIPPRTRCLYSVLVMHRRKDLWGPDALTFDPDRFLDERVQKYLVPNPFIFLPFNAGPRICLGQQVRLSSVSVPHSIRIILSLRTTLTATPALQFAYNEISFMLVRLLQRFAGIRLRQDAHPASVPPPGVERSPYAVDGRERVWMRSHLTAYAKNGLWVEMDEVVQD